MMILGEPDRETPSQQVARVEERGSARRMALVALLIVLAIFGYLYFFTDLIRSHEQPRQVAPAPVRKPLPRKGVPQGTASSSARSAPAPPRPGTSSATVPPPAGSVTPVPAASSPAGSLPAGKAVPTEPQHPQKALPPSPPSVTSPPREGNVTAPRSGAYAIQCGPFVSSREMIPARAILRNAGLHPVVSPGPKRSTVMYRLFVAGFRDAALAAREQKKLLAATPDAFVLLIDGAYELYAGSYHEERRARAMEGRLAARGVEVELRQVSAPVPTRWLSADVLQTRDAADAVAGRLKQKGIPCTVRQRGH